MLNFRLRLKPVGLPEIVKPIAPNRWCYMGYSFGAWLDDCGRGRYSLLMLNGAVGRDTNIGGIYYEYITLEVDGVTFDADIGIHERAGHTQAGPEITMRPTVGHGYFQGEGVKVLRFWVGADAAGLYDGAPLVNAHPFLAIPKALEANGKTYDAKADEILLHLRMGTTNPGLGLHARCSEWMPYDSPGPGDGGGWRICPLPGWTHSRKFSIVTGDLTAERCKIRVDAWTGDPIFAEEPGYECTRGWNKSTTRKDFVVPVDANDQYGWNDGRRPRNVNTGTCWYESVLVGELAFYSNGTPFWRPGYQMFDRAHFVRAFSPFVENWYRWGDKTSLRILRGLAADGFAGAHRESAPSAKSRKYGREWAWPALCLLVAGERTRARALMTSANRAKLKNEAWYQAPFEGRDAYGFNPDPWITTDPKYPLNARPNTDQMQTMEGGYMALVNILCGFLEAGEMFLHKVYNDPASSFMQTGYTGKWYGVAVDGVVTDSLVEPVGPDESVMLWPAVAAAARLDESGPRSWLRAVQRWLGMRPEKWVERMERMHVPGRGYECGTNIVTSLKAEPTYWEQSAPAMEVAERA